MQPNDTAQPRATLRWPEILAAAAVACALVWSLWPALVDMVERWSNDARYSHGFLVLPFAIGFLYSRRKELPNFASLKPNLVWGLGLLALGVLTQLVGGYVGSMWVVGMALIPYLLSVAALVGGTAVLRWAAPAILFLAFMVPLPYRVENALGPPLQLVATKLSTYALQTVGLMAFASGNVIRIGDFRIGVVEACSGLSMLMTFTALSVAAAMAAKRPWIDRVMLVLAALPVALIANTARIVLTGFLYTKVDSKTAEHFYHDMAGWLMIVFALLLLWLISRVWSWLVVENTIPEKIPVVVGISSSGARVASTDAQAGSRGDAGRGPAVSGGMILPPARRKRK